MFDTYQPLLRGVDVALNDAHPDPGADYGEVFTRRWVVEMILDLVGYTPDKDLGGARLVEPSCGTGAFLVPVVERLIESAKRQGRPIGSLGEAVTAFDLLNANAERARKAVSGLLTGAGMSVIDATTMASGWIKTGDFLLDADTVAQADFVVGNPPYIRLESVPAATMAAYRARCSTMRGRADIYVGFFEVGLSILKPGGTLSFICADRWMRNQYGAALRDLVTSAYAVDTVISMHDVDAFEDDVSAYPAVVVLRNGSHQRTAVVETDRTFEEATSSNLVSWIKRGRRAKKEAGYDATKVDRWFEGSDLWPAGSPEALALIAELEARFPPLQDEATGTRVGIGVATGCDEIFITQDPSLVEEDRLLPLVQARHLTGGQVEWSQTYLVNPWNGDGLVDLDRYPTLRDYLDDHADRLRARHVARKRPGQWYRTIDRVNLGLLDRPRLLLPDMKATAHPVLDEGGHYPHHNLYYVVSDSWDPELLGGLLLSDVANLFVGAYCVRMRGGCYRFQAQYLRRIRVPELTSIEPAIKRGLAKAFRERDAERATALAARAYRVEGRLPGTEGA